MRKDSKMPKGKDTNTIEEKDTDTTPIENNTDDNDTIDSSDNNETMMTILQNLVKSVSTLQEDVASMKVSTTNPIEDGEIVNEGNPPSKDELNSSDVGVDFDFKPLDELNLI